MSWLDQVPDDMAEIIAGDEIGMTATYTAVHDGSTFSVVIATDDDQVTVDLDGAVEIDDRHQIFETVLSRITDELSRQPIHGDTLTITETSGAHLTAAYAGTWTVLHSTPDNAGCVRMFVRKAEPISARGGDAYGGGG